MRVRHTFFFFFFLVLSSCGSCGDNPGTTSATNPTSSTSVRTSATITMSALSGMKVTVSIPLAAFGDEEGLTTTTIDIFVNNVLRIDDLLAQDYYNASTQQVRFTMQPLSDGDELSFTIHLNDSNFTYTGQVSATQETQAAFQSLGDLSSGFNETQKTLFLLENSDGTYDVQLSLLLFGNSETNLNGVSLLIDVQNEFLSSADSFLYPLNSFYDASENKVVLPNLAFENFDQIDFTLTLSDGEVRKFFIFFREETYTVPLIIEYAAFLTTSSVQTQSFSLDEASSNYSSNCDANFILDFDFMIDATLSLGQVEDIIANGQTLFSPTQMSLTLDLGRARTNWSDYLADQIVVNIDDNGNFLGYRHWMLPSQLDYSYELIGTIVENEITVSFTQQLSSSLVPYAGESCEVAVTWTGYVE